MCWRSYYRMWGRTVVKWNQPVFALSSRPDSNELSWLNWVQTMNDLIWVFHSTLIRMNTMPCYSFKIKNGHYLDRATWFYSYWMIWQGQTKREVDRAQVCSPCFSAHYTLPLPSPSSFQIPEENHCSVLFFSNSGDLASRKNFTVVCFKISVLNPSGIFAFQYKCLTSKELTYLLKHG